MIEYYYLLCAVWITQAATQLNQWQCSTLDRDGYTYFPDVPADKYHIQDAKIATLTRAFYIYSPTPPSECNGTIIGADFCYHQANATDIELKRVFELIIFEHVGEIFIPDSSYPAQTFSAIPLDQTNCINQMQDPGFLCCQRMTIVPYGLRLTGRELSFGILAQNIQPTDYPLLNFGVILDQYHVQAYRVEFERLTNPEDIYNNTYDSSNTNKVVTSLPVLRFVLEPDNNGTARQNTCNVAAVAGSLSTILAIMTIALVALTTILIVVGTHYWRMKTKLIKKEHVIYEPKTSHRYVLDPSQSKNAQELGCQSPHTDVGGQDRISYNRPRVPAKPKPMYVNASSVSIPTLRQSVERDEQGYEVVDRAKLASPPDDV